MNPITGTLRGRFGIGAAIILIATLAFAGSAWAIYPPDGTKTTVCTAAGVPFACCTGAGTGTCTGNIGMYRNPDDGICVVGIKLDGTMLVDWSIKNYKDCDAWTKSAPGIAGTPVDLVGMATSATCANAVNPPTGLPGANDGYRHKWSTSLCYDTVNLKGVSRVDLDNTDAMCKAKGGTVVTSGKCVAYGWQYLNRKPDGALPVVPGTGLATIPADGGVRNPTDGLGFCYTTVNLTGGAPDGTYTSNATCPSFHNSFSLAGLTEWPTAGCNSNPDGCQTQASYDSGLGWTWTTTAPIQCRYSYGVIGKVTANIVNAAGTTTFAAGAVVNLNGGAYDTMGECLAAGFSWDNWLPVTKTVEKTSADPAYAGMPAGTLIKKLDALTDVDHGGGDFISGTGAICQKCHSDMSRAYMERYKPGFPETRHKLAGDAIGQPFQSYFTAANSPWGLKGVQCAMCHSTARPAKDDLLQVHPAGVTSNENCTTSASPWSCCTGFKTGTCSLVVEGSPKSATGHNNTEYGTQLVDLCYTCHGTAATPTSTNPATVIPSTTSDFNLTSKGLAPIANQFLNSPHAKYVGNSSKIDVGNKTKYTSFFEGYVCRSAATQFRKSPGVFPGESQASCEAAGHTWYTGASMGANQCYYNPTSCEAADGIIGNGTPVWTTSFDAAAYSWAVGTAPANPGAVCYGIGLGSILTTYYRSGASHRIHNLDSVTNTACTNVADLTPNSGASGYWLRDGENSLGSPTLTDQGNCMTCHDVHWALASAEAEAEPLRRECTSCHVDPVDSPASSASLAPQIDPARINHLSSAGTPLEHLATDPDEACETCHMPKSSANGSNMHLFRISTSSTYTTMGATQANSAADGAYPAASWVDIDHACGQCHFTTGAVYVSNNSPANWPIFTKGQLAIAARDIHRIPASPNPTPQATQTCSVTADTSPFCTAAGVPWACCTGIGTGPCNGANNWTVVVTDTSPNSTYISRETVNWADGSVVADVRAPQPFGPFHHTYISPGAYTIVHTVIDTAGQVATSTCTANWSYYSISGTATTANTVTSNALCTGALAPWACCSGAGAGTCDTDTVPLINTTVTATNTNTGLVSGTAVTGVTGTYTLGSLKPGSYAVAFSRVGYSFPVLPPIQTIGPSQINVNAVGTLALRAIRPVTPKDFKNSGKLGAGPVGN